MFSILIEQSDGSWVEWGAEETRERAQFVAWSLEDEGATVRIAEGS